MWEQFAQYGLVGLMICAGIVGVAWVGVRTLGKDGLLANFILALNKNSESVEAVAECVKQHGVDTTNHIATSAGTDKNVNRLVRTAIVAIDEAESLCKANGLQATEQFARIRRELEQTT